MSGFVVRGSLVYRPPCDYLLHAVSFDTSSFTSSRIFVEAFVQPLYHSYDHLAFTYGFRLGDDFWDIDEADPDRTFVAIAEEVRIHALPFFAAVPDLDRFCALVPEWEKEQPRRIMQDNSLDDPVVLEASRMRRSCGETRTEPPNYSKKRLPQRSSPASTETTAASGTRIRHAPLHCGTVFVSCD